MKEHLTSIQSTRPAQQKSIFSYYHHQYNNHSNSVNYNSNNNTSTMSLITNNYNNNNIDNINKYNYNKNIAISNYKRELNNMFKTFQQILKMRSYLLQRDIQEIYDKVRSFCQHFLSIYSVEELVAFVYENKNRSNNYNKNNNNKINTDQKLYQRDQLQFIVNIIFELNTRKNQSASNSNMKQFQLIKQLLQFIQQKSIKYEKFIRQVKEKKHMEMKLSQYNERKKQFGEYQNMVRKSMGERHERVKSIEMDKLKHNQYNNNNINNNNSMIRQDKTQQKLQYITNPSKQLSQAKQLSLRVKLSPYASQKKRQYDYSALTKQLAQTINHDMQRKYNMLDRMKTIQKEKLNKLFKRRYSVVEDKLKEEMDSTQRKLQGEKERLNKSLNNSLQTISNNSKRKKNQILYQLKNSLNAFNMHSDTQQIKKIIKHHRNRLQFESDVKQVSNLRTVSEYQPKYATLSYTMMSKYKKGQLYQSQDNIMMSVREKQRQQNRILRRLATKHKDNNKTSLKQCQCEYDLINNNRNNKNNEFNRSTINKQKSLVALYDDQLELDNVEKKEMNN